MSLPSADLPSHYHVRSLQHPSFNLPPQRCRLTINVAWTSLSSTLSPTLPPLPCVVIKSPLSMCAHHRCHRGTSTYSSHCHSHVSSSHCQHCLHLLVTVACTFSGNYFLVLFPSCCCSCVHVGGHGHGQTCYACIVGLYSRGRLAHSREGNTSMTMNLYLTT